MVPKGTIVFSSTSNLVVYSGHWTQGHLGLVGLSFRQTEDELTHHLDLFTFQCTCTQKKFLVEKLGEQYLL